MKKILLATSALVLSAGLAQAQGLSIGGQGRMGIIHTNTGPTAGTWWFGPTAASTTTVQENRFRLNITATAQADHGLSFGAFTRIDTFGGAAGVASGSRVWVEASGLRLTFGNQDGALRGAGTAMGYLGGCGIGYVGGHLCHDTAGMLPLSQGFASTGGGAAHRARIDYTMGDFRFAVSHDRGFGGTSRSTEVGVRYSFDAFTVAAGYRPASNTGQTVLGVLTLSPRIITASAHYNGGSWGVGALVARIGTLTTGNVQASAELGGGTLYAYVGRTRVQNTLFPGAWIAGTAPAAGINYSYGLGGGASIVAGIEHVGRNNVVDNARTTVASVGVTFNF